MTVASVKLMILTNPALSGKCGLVCLRVKYVTCVTKRAVFAHTLEQTKLWQLISHVSHVVLVSSHYHLVIAMQRSRGCCSWIFNLPGHSQ